MTKYLPFIVLLPVLAVLTGYQWYLMNWVWGANMPAKQCAYLLQTGIPKEFGDWVGEDNEVAEDVRKLAGADGYIDRIYRNKKTNEQVSIWFIVGHFRQVSQHTPNICYVNAGYEQVGKIGAVDIDVPQLPTAEFSTAKFRLARNGQEAFQRVYWAWWKPEPLAEGTSADNVSIVWTSPEDARVAFGYCRALYKLYFTSISSPDEKATESVCLEFAREFLPIADKAIRESGLVMVLDDLPADAKQVFEEMEAANSGQNKQPANKEETEDIEQTEAADQAA
ncbi:exosortase-associated EpsI family protein [Aeoliella mucimassa]|uniref:Methanolan biosynthesis EpsI domain-containing protein n=1 Tax=Aeoliella mucimassa TaxID=2527972 RepID=A0A518ATZ3_9BACT|nr:exosortase-associated EpsI family protein [Aeoliella mucimassa]QDU58177.1 hypothetical protein Pan181_44090 [Aeoliella mucimassa]